MKGTVEKSFDIIQSLAIPFDSGKVVKSPKKEDLNKPIDECIKEYIENKINIIEGLRNFYYKSNDNSASATTYILELAGFAKCKSCS